MAPVYWPGRNNDRTWLATLDTAVANCWLIGKVGLLVVVLVVDSVVEDGGKLDAGVEEGGKVVGIVELLGKVLLANKAWTAVDVV